MTYYRIDLAGGGQEVILDGQEHKLAASGTITVFDADGNVIRAYSPGGWKKLQRVDE